VCLYSIHSNHITSKYPFLFLFLFLTPYLLRFNLYSPLSNLHPSFRRIVCSHFSLAMVGLGKAKTKSASIITGAGATARLGPSSGLSEDDDYELQPSSYTDHPGLHSHSHGHSQASEPLLPQYDPKSPSSPVPLAPHRQLERSRRRSRTCATLLCLWATLVPLFLGMALLGCWFGRKGLDSVRGWQAWEQVPQDIKDWVDAVAPYQAAVDHGAFPTE
jgi:hypothetical protein